eukprot:CAMPEP_0198568416 /NCGR_PEP_ID=MMETSP1462-20131121/106404_1 /TAXON_ID=1333877 /ORGANISM="Brandtodinium nutriculum, Strain RCC3387" /LENGTH=227 /DNA_ID=CAMNT_0044299487 /DNA_START=5 /DNA_END=688 /DNA_ORIENTATION=+
MADLEQSSSSPAADGGVAPQRELARSYFALHAAQFMIIAAMAWALARYCFVDLSEPTMIALSCASGAMIVVLLVASFACTSFLATHHLACVGLLLYTACVSVLAGLFCTIPGATWWTLGLAMAVAGFVWVVATGLVVFKLTDPKGTSIIAALIGVVALVAAACAGEFCKLGGEVTFRVGSSVGVLIYFLWLTLMFMDVKPGERGLAAVVLDVQCTFFVAIPMILVRL